MRSTERLTKEGNFSLGEFLSRDGYLPTPAELDNLRELASQLEILREVLAELYPDREKKGVRILSGQRSVSHNAKVGGKKKSYHIPGKAADITSPDVTPKDIAVVIDKLMRKGVTLKDGRLRKITKGGCKAYETFVHYDIRGRIATW